MNPATVFDFPEAKGVVICGDIHGEFNQLVHKCCVQYGMTDTVIIVAGDCGFGFEQQGYYENIYTVQVEQLDSVCQRQPRQSGLL